MLLTFLSAVLFYLSFPNSIFMYGFWPCIWIFGVPLLLALRDQPLNKRLGYCLMWGICVYGLMAQGLAGISMAGFMVFVMSLTVQALFFGLFFRSTKYLWGDIFYIPIIWCVSEFVRNYVLGGFSFYISHAQAFCPVMLKLYGIIGCLGMSFLIMMVNGLIYLGVANKKHQMKLLGASGIVVLVVVGTGFWKNPQTLQKLRHFRISVIQANISPLEKMDLNLFEHNAMRHLDLTEKSFKKGQPDLVIWPETAYPDDLLQNGRWLGLVTRQAASMHAYLLLGMAPIVEHRRS